MNTWWKCYHIVCVILLMRLTMTFLSYYIAPFSKLLTVYTVCLDIDQNANNKWLVISLKEVCFKTSSQAKSQWKDHKQTFQKCLNLWICGALSYFNHWTIYRKDWVSHQSEFVWVCFIWTGPILVVILKRFFIWNESKNGFSSNLCFRQQVELNIKCYNVLEKFYIAL